MIQATKSASVCCINRLIDHTSNLRKQSIAWHERTAGVERKEEIASGLHEKLNALFESVDSADRAPPKQARDVFEKLGDEMEGLQAQISSAQCDASKLSQQISAAGIPTIGVTG